MQPTLTLQRGIGETFQFTASTEAGSGQSLRINQECFTWLKGSQGLWSNKLLFQLVDTGKTTKKDPVGAPVGHALVDVSQVAMRCNLDSLHSLEWPPARPCLQLHEDQKKELTVPLKRGGFNAGDNTLQQALDDAVVSGRCCNQ